MTAGDAGIRSAAWIIAALRVAEARLRDSTPLTRASRSTLAWLSRRSNNARAYVRLRVMRMI